MATQPPDLSLKELCAWRLLSCSAYWESDGILADRHSWLNRSQLGAELLLLPLLDGLRRFTPARFDYRRMPDRPVRVTASAIHQVALFRGACVSRLDLLPSNAAPCLGDEPYPGAQQDLLTALLNLTPASLYLYEGLALEPPLDAYIVHLRRLASLLHTLDIGAHYPDLIRAEHRISFNRVTCLRARLPANPDANPLADLDVRFICANLVSLDLAGSSITAAQLLAAPRMPALRCLGLRRCAVLFLADSENITVAYLLETYSFDMEVAARLDELAETEISGLDVICEKFPLLESLDIGQPPKEPLPDAETLVFPFADPTEQLRRLVRRLPRLRRLDLSFTSLTDAAPDLVVELSGFDYLGLFGATTHIEPLTGADRLGSDRSLAGFACLLREFSRDPQAATIVLRSLFQFLRLPAQPGPDNSPHCGLRLLSRLLDIMEDFVWANGLEALFLQASASIYYLIRAYLHSRPSALFDTVCRCLDVIATSIYRWRLDALTRRNFLLSLFLLLNNDVEAAIMSCSRVKLVRSLLFVLDQSCSEDEAESIRYVLAVINYLAISFDEPERQFVGCECHLVRHVLQFIEGRLEPPRRSSSTPGLLAQCLSSAWSILWNITDESEPNCADFMRHGGLQCLVRCHQLHSAAQDPSQELMRNVLGLLGNVSEVPSLAADLLVGSKEIADILLVYLNRWTADNVEAAYNAAGIVAHCLHSRRDTTLTDAERELDAKVSEVIRMWPTSNLSRQINYRSFQPILRLLRCRRSRASYAWGAWALMSMCKHMPNKYVPLLASEGGRDVLDKFIQEVGDDFEAAYWARETLDMLEEQQARSS